MPEGFERDICDLRRVLEPQVVSDYFYRPNEKGVGGIFVFADMGSHKSGIINRASQDDFLFTDPYWLREIFAYGLREGMIDERFFRSFDKLPINKLDAYVCRLWKRLFGNSRCFATVFCFNPQKLLKDIVLLPEDEERKGLKRLFDEDFRNSILKDASSFKMPKGYAIRTRYLEKERTPLSEFLLAIKEKAAAERERASVLAQEEESDKGV